VHALLDARPPFPLVTGQNPASSRLTAELVVEALGGHKAARPPADCELAVGA
jgi:putative intracellular protease/amidase